MYTGARFYTQEAHEQADAAQETHTRVLPKDLEIRRLWFVMKHGRPHPSHRPQEPGHRLEFKVLDVWEHHRIGDS
jgi:hypothetical protein